MGVYITSLVRLLYHAACYITKHLNPPIETISIEKIQVIYESNINLLHYQQQAPS